MAAEPRELARRFEPASFETFRFVSREIDDRGTVRLLYALDDAVEFVEEFDLPVAGRLTPSDRERIDGLLSLLHWVAGVSYFKTAAPPAVRCEAGTPPPATVALLEALYSEGLGEFAFVNELPAVPRPRFPAAADDRDAPVPAGPVPAGPVPAGPVPAGQVPTGPVPTGPVPAGPIPAGPVSAGPVPAGPVPAGSGQAGEPHELARVLVPIGGGKDSVVALEIVRRSGLDVSLFSVGDAPAIARTGHVSGIPRLVAQRRLDPGLGELNRTGALNGHVPVTAIVSCVALLTAALNGFDAVAMANERSASSGNVVWDGIDVNHQFSKGLQVERLFQAAVAELAPDLQLFSILRPASELGIARAFARLTGYHAAFTSCNAIFRLDATLRAASWCCDCPKCRFVFLILAPFIEPAHLREIFGEDLLADEGQFAGFALLTATGGNKPFECVGEEEESLAAVRMLAIDPRWSGHPVVRRLVDEVVPQFPASAGSPAQTLVLSDDHRVPATLLPYVRAILGA